MADAAYEAVVKETFETKPLRTVLMIDDEFPTFTDLAQGETDANRKRFSQKPLAAALYEGFKKSHMICDIANSVEADQPERLRKSDLVVLDFHLGPGNNNSEQSIKLLRDLAQSKHFNTVVVYTKETDQDQVWLDIISCIRGGWSGLPATLSDVARTEWERLRDETAMQPPPKEAVMQFVARGRIADIDAGIVEAMKAELNEHEVPAELQEVMFEAFLHRSLAEIAGEYADRPGWPAAVGGFADGVRWIQSQNAFIAILEKADLPEDGVAPADEKDPVGIMAGLRKALLAWQPNLIQILISEVQNVLELEALATADGQLQKSETQTALWYYLLQSLGKIDFNAVPDVTSPIIAIIDKILDGIRQKLVSDDELLTHASNALIGSLKETNWTPATWPQNRALFDGAKRLAGADGLVELERTMFRLNAFFSTEEFARPHLTTGTIFKKAAGDDTYWVVSSPACDLEDRLPGERQKWARSIDPLTAVIALRLERTTDVKKALKQADTGRFLFLENAAGDQSAFRLLDDAGNPSYEYFFAHDRGKVTREGARKVFTAHQLVVNQAATTGQLVAEQFQIVHQLRDLNASRTLGVAGQHLSRIGLDFVSTPKGNG